MSTSVPLEFSYIQKLVYDRAAIVLEPDKMYLIESRLMPLARREGLHSLMELASRLQKERFNGLHQDVIEAMTTNETSFFRDHAPFECLKNKILPELIDKRSSGRTLNIWCAASASGQEPYTLAMIMHDHFPMLMNWTVRFYASDISQEMLTRCKSGRYTQFEVNRGLPASLLVKYFTKEGNDWQIADTLRRMITFIEINLSDHWPILPDIDLILMRNVMIYFDVNTKKTILSKVRRVLKDDGYLMLGTAETTLNIDDSFKRIQFDNITCYQP